MTQYPSLLKRQKMKILLLAFPDAATHPSWVRIQADHWLTTQSWATTQGRTSDGISLRWVSSVRHKLPGRTNGTDAHAILWGTECSWSRSRDKNMLWAMWVQSGVFIVYIVPMNVLVQQNILQLEPWITHLWTDLSGVCILAGTTPSLFFKMSRMSLGLSTLLLSRYWSCFPRGSHSQGVRPTDHSSALCLHGVYKDNFTFTILLTFCNFQSTNTVSYQPYWNGQLCRNWFQR
jgi:hypothetical protein